jgi:hypothetical protein
VRTKTIRKLLTTGLVVTVATLALATSAFGQTSSVETYGGGGGEFQSGVNNAADPGDHSATADTSSALPFTGLDLGLAAGGGLLLLGIGASMATLSSRRERQSF